MTFDELKALDHAHTLQTYGRFDVDVDHGQGATLWDLAGRTYIDFTSGIGVCSVGYGNEKWARAIYDQALTLGHISNLFYSQPYARLAGALCARSGMAAAFFGNSGAEANEGLLKLARKYSHDKYGAGRGTILTLRNSFHGRTLATLAATGQDVFHQHFFPFPEGFRHTGANDLADVEAQAGRTCAPCCWSWSRARAACSYGRDFVRALAGLCEQRDWLLLVDEVQTGIGRTGTLFAFQQYGIRPDAVSFAKGIAGGLPMGGFLVNEKCRPVLGPGSHASTFGGNPVCSAAALAVLDILDEAALNRVREKGAYLRERIEAMGKRCLGATRGLGLMIGVEVRPGWSNRELVARLAGHGLLMLTAGPALRLLPPDHHEGRDGPGPGHPGPGPGVTPGCARHFCMR
ncbi:MAG: aminotransferase class III-fold pyridoxal phosphate-dependent enzyme [Flavonifractor plautii]